MIDILVRFRIMKTGVGTAGVSLEMNGREKKDEIFGKFLQLCVVAMVGENDTAGLCTQSKGNGV